MTVDTVENTDKTDKKPVENDEKRRFRRFFAQFLATTVKNLLLFDLGMCVAFPRIVIPALTGISNSFNANESLSLTPVQSSWLGSIGFIAQPLGSILSALITDPLGRRRAMMLVNIPFVIGWYLMYTANNVLEIFVATTLLGLGVGLMESPVLTYLGEICEPSLRGILIAYSNLSVSFGVFTVFLLNTLMPWRSAALLCLFVPIISITALCFVPETPLWLLSKNRVVEAEKSLCWLRGWVPSDKIVEEFKNMQRYSERSKSCSACVKKKLDCPHPPPTTVEKLKELKRKQTLKPFFIVTLLFLIGLFSGIMAMNPFIVQVMRAYESPIAPDRTAAMLSLVNSIANICSLCLVRFTGKRKLYLATLTGALLCAIVVSSYGFAILPSGYNSFDKSQTFSLANKNLAFIPFVCIIIWTFCTFCGIYLLPWQMLSEVFPYKTRGVATGLVAAASYIMHFICIKMYYNLETLLSLPGVAAFNCCVIFTGLIVMYNVLPETENRTLEDIELHFSDNTKKFTDRNIKMHSKKNVENGTVLGSKTEISGDVESNGCDNKGFTPDS